MAHDDDAVGYGRPPKNGRFKPGKSGNPQGRPKGSSNFKTDLAAEMRERITLRGKDGRSHRVTKQRALIKLLFSSALQNEKSAITALLACMRYFGTGNEEPATEAADVEDLDMIRDYIERTEARLKHQNKPTQTTTSRRKGGPKSPSSI
jgi:uncharacterized protein YdiU (UPF0061 family)